MRILSVAAFCLSVGVALNLAGCGRSVVIICPWAAGGGTDTNSRMLAEALKQELGQAVNVVNRTGGAGVTGHGAGARARPDGATLTMMTVEINMLHWRGLTEICWRDFQPVALINEDAAAILVRNDSPWKSLADLTAAVRKEPGKLRASGTAAGGIWHLALSGWLTGAGLPANAVTWIPSKGAAPSLVELLGGGVDMVSCSLPEAKSQLVDGKVRAVGIMADERSRFFPDVPTFKEQGVAWTLAGWRGIGVPKGTPEEIVDKLEAAIRRIVEGQEYREKMGNIGFDVRFLDRSTFTTFLGEQDALLGKLLKECGLEG